MIFIANHHTILPPSATKFSIPDLQCKNHKNAGDQGDDSRPCRRVSIEDPMAARVSCTAITRKFQDIKVTPNQPPNTKFVCFWMDELKIWYGWPCYKYSSWLSQIPMPPESSKLWALSMVEWSFCRCAPRPYPCATWHIFTSKDKDQAAHFCTRPYEKGVCFFVSSSKRLQLIKLQSQIPFPKLG